MASASARLRKGVGFLPKAFWLSEGTVRDVKSGNNPLIKNIIKLRVRALIDFQERG